MVDGGGFFIYAASDIGEVCEAALTTGIEPLAVGEATVRATDNFLDFEPGSRTNSFGSPANGTVYDANGDAWSFHGHSRLQLTRNGEFRILTESINLRRRG